jgi:hypothetical protein
VSLCRELDRLEGEQRSMIFWDWTGGIYLGDTAMDYWTANPSGHGYDSWPCTRPHSMRGFDSLAALRAELAQPAAEPGVSHLILGARMRNDAELLQQWDSDVLQQRLDGYLHELGAPAELVARCRFFSDSLWFRYALCPLAGWTESRDSRPGF